MPLPPSDSDAIDWTLIDRYIAGGCPAAERAQVEEWLAADPSRRAHLDALRALRAAAAALPVPDTSASWARLRQRVVSGAPKAPHRAHHIWPRGVGSGVRGQGSGRVAAVAAVVLVALGVGLVVRRSLISDPRSLTPAVREYATAAGQRLSITLVDGTQLTLAPASRVRVAADYGHASGSRDVELEGEAYFAVVHDAARPFAVRARGAVTRDVGTAFDVRAYPEEAGARVVVAEGVVAVTAVGGCRASGVCAAEARVGDVVAVAQRGVAVEHGMDVASLTAWRRGELVFAKTPLRDVLAELGRWYDLDVSLGDPAVGDRLVSTSFQDEPVNDVVAALAATLGVRYERRGRAVVFAPVAGHLQPTQ